MEAYHNSGFTVEELRTMICTNPETGKEDWIKLLPELVSLVGPGAGIVAWRFVFLSGKSTLLKDGAEGWFFKSRDELQLETGLGHREQEKARAILRGDKPWAGKTHHLVDERRPSRRSPAEYRMRLLDLAVLLGRPVPMPDDLDELGEWDDDETFEEALYGEYAESPREATESPRTGPLSRPVMATESPHAGPLQGDVQGNAHGIPSETTALQAGTPGFSSRVAPPPKGKDSPALKPDGDAPAGQRNADDGGTVEAAGEEGDNIYRMPPSLTGGAKTARLDPAVRNKAWALFADNVGVGRLVDAGADAGSITDEVARLLGDGAPTDRRALELWVRRCVEDRRAEAMRVG